MANRLAAVLLAAAIVLVGLAAVGSAAGWWRVDVVLSGSMRPGIQPGDEVVLRPEPVSSVRVGQVLAFRPPKLSFVVTHRVIQVTRTRGQTIIRTKGDSNNVADPWRAVLEGRTAWRVVYVIPKIGYVTEWAKGRTVRLGVSIGLASIFAAFALAHIWRKPSKGRPPGSADGEEPGASHVTAGEERHLELVLRRSDQ